jgi:hypothetical protein
MWTVWAHGDYPGADPTAGLAAIGRSELASEPKNLALPELCGLGHITENEKGGVPCNATR